MGALEPYHGTYVNAKSASADLDLGAILAGCAAVDAEAGNISEVSNSLNTAASDLTPTVFSVNGVSIGSNVGDYCSNIMEAQSWIMGQTAAIRAAAENAYNKLQTDYNNEAMARDAAEKNRRANMNRRG